MIEKSTNYPFKALSPFPAMTSFLFFLSLQLQFRFFRQQTSVSGPDSRPQLQHPASSASSSPPSSSPVTFHGPAGHPTSSHSSSTSSAAAPSDTASTCSSPDCPRGAAPRPSACGTTPTLFLPGSSPAGPGQGPTHGLWDTVRWHHPASSSTAASPTPLRGSELITLHVRRTTRAGLSLSRSHGLPTAPHAPRCGVQEAPSSQSAPYQRRTQRSAGSHQKRWVVLMLKSDLCFILLCFIIFVIGHLNDTLP